MGPLRVFACHGSPRQVNEFLWETTTPSHFLAKFAADADCGVILAGARGFTAAAGSRAGAGCVNAGAMGRPAIYGRTCVWYV